MGAQQAFSGLSTSWEQAVRTHPVHKSLEQHCYKSAAGLLQVVRFYVGTSRSSINKCGGPDLDLGILRSICPTLAQLRMPGSLLPLPSQNVFREAGLRG